METPETNSTPTPNEPKKNYGSIFLILAIVGAGLYFGSGYVYDLINKPVVKKDSTAVVKPVDSVAVKSVVDTAAKAVVDTTKK